MTFDLTFDRHKSRRIVAAVDRASLAEGRAPTLPFVRKVLAVL